MLDKDDRKALDSDVIPWVAKTLTGARKTGRAKCWVDMTTTSVKDSLPLISKGLKRKGFTLVQKRKNVFMTGKVTVRITNGTKLVFRYKPEIEVG